MAHITVSVEYGIHCLLWLVESRETPLSSRDLAELQGISPSFLAKIFPKLEKAGIVRAAEGIKGGYTLARLPAAISFLDIVDAIEGNKPLFDCQEVRTRCPLFRGAAPKWATSGVCGIHGAMLRAEKSMRDALARETLGDVARAYGRKTPAEFSDEVSAWLAQRIQTRTRNQAASRTAAKAVNVEPHGDTKSVRVRRVSADNNRQRTKK